MGLAEAQTNQPSPKPTTGFLAGLQSPTRPTVAATAPGPGRRGRPLGALSRKPINRGLGFAPAPAVVPRISARVVTPNSKYRDSPEPEPAPRKRPPSGCLPGRPPKRPDSDRPEGGSREFHPEFYPMGAPIRGANVALRGGGGGGVGGMGSRGGGMGSGIALGGIAHRLQACVESLDPPEGGIPEGGNPLMRSRLLPWAASGAAAVAIGRAAYPSADSAVAFGQPSTASGDSGVRSQVPVGLTGYAGFTPGPSLPPVASGGWGAMSPGMRPHAAAVGATHAVKPVSLSLNPDI